MRRGAAAAALALGLCGTPAAAQTAQRFADCTHVADARALDALRRPGIGARVCTIAPHLRFAILADNTVSWPQLRQGDGPWLSLADPLARKLWFTETMPLRVRFGEDGYVVLRDGAGAPRAIVYSALANHQLGGPNLTAYVALRVAGPCALMVTADRAAALRAAGDANATCLPKVE